ncbi:hypothetical protein TNCV_4587221 [Trichonephila clavipes]|nr:hypothetical protein TNCV_4587221 [Trichonephila clavipes]
MCWAAREGRDRRTGSSPSRYRPQKSMKWKTKIRWSELALLLSMTEEVYRKADIRRVPNKGWGERNIELGL